jgi:hypothetical protein
VFQSKKMKIDFKKVNVSNHEMEIVRSDYSTEKTILDTKTYLLHDICHFFVEKELNTLDGFWGMLSQGYQLEQLFGKTNHLTEKLRVIEFIVGGTQSVYSKHMDESEFWNYIKAVDLKISGTEFLKRVIPPIEDFMNRWKFLPIGDSMTLHF